jgi:hypothetical protein
MKITEKIYLYNIDIYIVNGRVGGDKYVGGLTCKSSSTVDYVLASAQMFKYIQEFDILDFCNLFSDVHNPISFSILPASLREESCEGIVETQSCVKLWSLDQVNNFPRNVDVFKVKDIENELDILTNMAIGNVCKNTVKAILDKLCDVFLSTAKSTFGIRCQKNSVVHINKRDKPWFNRECRAARKTFHLAKRLHSRNAFLEN